MENQKVNNWPKVTIVFPNWNGKNDTLECLKSLAKLNYQKNNLEIIIADNGSNDGSQDAIKQELAKMTGYANLKMIEIGQNIGAPAALNLAIKAAKLDYDFVWKLDNDVIVDQNSLLYLVKEAIKENKIGMVAGTNYYYDQQTTVWAIGGKVDFTFGLSRNIGKNKQDQDQFKKDFSFDYLPGCALLVKKEVIQKIGLLDEKYFVYYDETDWNIRAKQAGFDLVYLPEAKIWHKASRTTQEGSIFKNYYLTRNKLLFIKKFNHKRLNVVLPIAAICFIDLPFRWIFRSKIKDLPNILKGATWGIIDALSKKPIYRKLN